MISLGSAAAQEVYVEEFDDYDDDAYVEAPAIVDEPAVVEEGPAGEGIVVGPRVYGWSEIRPANCGTFKYWNGDACVDARFDPPPEE
jgi:hypothetical protein